MTVGSPTVSGKPQVGLRYQCLQGQNRGPELDNFPTGPCSGGIFTTHHFPASVQPLLPYSLPSPLYHTPFTTLPSNSHNHKLPPLSLIHI